MLHGHVIWNMKLLEEHRLKNCIAFQLQKVHREDYSAAAWSQMSVLLVYADNANAGDDMNVVTVVMTLMIKMMLVLMTMMTAMMTITIGRLLTTAMMSRRWRRKTVHVNMHLGCQT